MDQDRMEWYYAHEGQQAGPVPDEELERLVAEGTIRPETLVWRTGMASWLPLEKARPPATGPVPPPLPLRTGVGWTVCSQCSQSVDADNVIRFQNLWVCAECKPLFFQKIKEGTRPAGVLEFAGIGARFVADMLDGIFVFLPFMVILQVVMWKFMRGAPEQPFGMLAVVLVMELGIWGIWAAYNIFFVGRYGATPGKMIFRIRIITTDRGRLGYGRATGRFFAEMLSGMTLYIGYIMAFFDEQRRTLHDRICNTLVIRE